MTGKISSIIIYTALKVLRKKVLKLVTYIMDKNDENMYYCCLWFWPDFHDRHGAWLTFGNVDLHLIKGRPAVHADDDLIVSHIAIVVSVKQD